MLIVGKFACIFVLERYPTAVRISQCWMVFLAGLALSTMYYKLACGCSYSLKVENLPSNVIGAYLSMAALTSLVTSLVLLKKLRF